MTYGEMAGLIAAIAFLLLVVFAGIFLMRLVQTLKKVDETIAQTTKTLSNVTDDVDLIAIQAENLMAKSNVLLQTVNNKTRELDPVFKAAAELGTSVSKLNESTSNAASRFSGLTKNMGKATVAGGLFKRFRNKKKK
ncbi:DUF948 domain-containing protein [Holzapfeliella floricola]|uniref:DUF948 domain-containing protein n=1 Tax=Holzapfeliella floricola DSM 23037 = JCM 16512 TaxID=1423744 RepID=A0A0R2DMY1_9LACO|nr:DUF948 domain-containing protein [Holzapfeliella floricola]KRN04523.1 hypothetical protein FC86_GL000200 [Holzapfeliella floricola DSM 23037 = JCM 16512]